MSEDIPQQWRAILEPKRIHSYRDLARAADKSHETVRRVVLGHRTSPASVQAVADAAGVQPERVYELRGESAPDTSREWTPPAVSSSLTFEEREALSRLISAVVRAREESGGDDRDAASMRAQVTGDLLDQVRVLIRAAEEGQAPMRVLDAMLELLPFTGGHDDLRVTALAAFTDASGPGVRVRDRGRTPGTTPGPGSPVRRASPRGAGRGG